MKIYAIADLHGSLDLFEKALVQIQAKELDNKYKLVTLGDYIDRGPQSCQLIERFMRGPNDNATWHHLRGNHEQMMIDVFDGVCSVEHWMMNGSDTTIASYTDIDDLTYETIHDIVPASHYEWLKALPCFYIYGDFLFVHAGMISGLEIEETPPKEMMWHRYKPANDPVVYSCRGVEYHIVHGHDGQSHGPISLPARTNLDTNAWKTGRLVVGVFDLKLANVNIEFMTICRDT